MNKNHKIIGLIILVVVASGVCVYLYIQNRNQKEQLDRLSRKEANRLKQELKEKVEANPDDNLDETIEQFLKENQEVFLDQNIQLIKQEIKKELEDSLKEMIQNEIPLDLEKLNQLLQSNDANAVNALTVEVNEIATPEPISDQVAPKEETLTNDLASDLEMNEKIISKYGEESFHNDIRKLATVKVNGRTPLESMDEAEELIRNISGYNNLRPTGKIFTIDFEGKELMLGFVYQLWKKHNIKQGIREKFASILTNHFSQFFDQSPTSLITYWARTMKGRTPEQLTNDPHFIYIEP